MADEIREILEDNDLETVPTRADIYAPHLSLEEIAFETVEDLQTWREDGRAIAKEALQSDFMIWITGNHLGALPIYESVSELSEDSLIVQWDAHLDIHHFDNCTEDLSHGNFLLHAEHLPNLVNVGHRELLLLDDYIAETFDDAFSALEVTGKPKRVAKQLRKRMQQSDSVYLDIDCDCFDPTYFPAVKNPVPFGLSPMQVVRMMEEIWSGNIRGLILSEFLPDRDENDRCLATIIWLIEHLLLKTFEA